VMTLKTLADVRKLLGDIPNCSAQCSMSGGVTDCAAGRAGDRRME
jgi:hypothetical protein